MSRLIVADDWIARLPTAVRDDLTARMSVHPLAAGALLVRSGEPAAAVFRVRAGFLKQTGVGEDGERTLLTVYGPGACFAETAVVADLPLNHSTQALTDAVIERLARADFWALYARHPAIADALCRKFAQAIRRQVADREERGALRARARIARVFADVAAGAGLREPDGRWRVDLPLTHGDIAAHLGLTRQSVQRELSHLRQGSAIVRLGSGWLIDREAIARDD